MTNQRSALKPFPALMSSRVSHKIISDSQNKVRTETHGQGDIVKLRSRSSKGQEGQSQARLSLENSKLREFKEGDLKLAKIEAGV